MHRLVFANILIFILLCLIPSRILPQTRSVNFESIGLDEGLSQGKINSLIQDAAGFIWIGTDDGLNRYNGYEFEIFRHQTKNNFSLSNSTIQSLCLDSSGNLWVGTLMGLNRFNDSLNHFETLRLIDQNNNNLSNSEIRSLVFDNNQNSLWIGTGTTGLLKYSLKTKKCTRYSIDNQKHRISDNRINAIAISKNHSIWVGTENGLNALQDTNNESFTIILHITNATNTISSNRIRSLVFDNKNQLWIGTADAGLNVLDLEQSKITAYRKSETMNSLSCDQVNCLLVDNDNVLWIGTEHGGLNRYENNSFTVFRHDPGRKRRLNANKITSLFRDKTSLLWIGTKEINKMNLHQEGFELYPPIPNDANSISFSLIRSFYRDLDGSLWVGTDGDGINRFNKAGKKIKHYQENDLKTGLKGNAVFSIIRDANYNIWIGTDKGLNQYQRQTDNFKFYNIENQNTNSAFQIIRYLFQGSDKNILWIATSGNGLIKMNLINQAFTIYRNQPNDSASISSDYIRCIVEDDEKNLWIGTFNGGLNSFNPKTETFERYFNAPENPLKQIITLSLHSQGMLLIGTLNSGLVVFNPKTKTHKIYNTQDRIPSNCINGILEDPNGCVWLSHNKGISKLNLKNDKMLHFSVLDGLQSNEFNGNAVYKDLDGKLFFGGIEGFNAFYADKISAYSMPATTILTDLYIHNHRIEPGINFNGRIILNNKINYTQHIDLKYDENIIAFEFIALHFISPSKNQYAYCLEGYDEDWIYVENRRFASYTNLAPGEYTFKVKASNNAGLWNENETRIKINIKKPFWNLWWFRLLIGLVIILLILLYIKLHTIKIRKQKLKLERMLKKSTAELEKTNQVLYQQYKELERQKKELAYHKEQLQKQNEEITKQKNEIVIKNEELKKLSIVASETDNAVVILDKYGNFEWVNSAFVNLYEQSLNEYIAKHGNNLFQASTNPRINEIIREININRKAINYESHYTTKRGEKKWFQTTLTPVLDENNEITYILAIDSDITRLKEAEQQIIAKSNEMQNQNKLITDSITYAKTIQELILPLQSKIDKHFDSFIVYRPKDIVSGDFYWFFETVEGSEFIIAMVDCTGHGVPGAFMSMIGSNMLHEFITQWGITEPSRIVEEMDKAIIKRLKQDYSENMDGMDLIICKIKLEGTKRIVDFCGASLPFIYYSKEEQKLFIEKGWNKTVGGIYFLKNEFDYTEKTIELNKGDIIYLATDGYSSQLNCKKTKYGSRRFHNLLRIIGNIDLYQQKEILEQEFDEFSMEIPQYDDISIWGIRV